MKSIGYGAIWAVLIGATALELVLYGASATVSGATTAIIGLAGLKATLIALFYQHVTREPRSIAFLYLAALLAGVGLIVGMVASMSWGAMK